MIYLYLKTHRKTGFKYLGKTVNDPFKYKGSGTHWLRHLNKHGYEVDTEILFTSDDKQEFKKVALKYSYDLDIVNSKNFANIRPESGDGGDTSDCENWKQGILKRDLKGNKNGMYGRSAVRDNNLRWYNNGYDNLYIKEGTQPQGYILGRIILYKKPHRVESKQKISHKNSKPCMSPNGEIYASRKAAAIAYNITPEAIGGLIKRGVSGWKWL
jgi:hypothetical protein